ncbi:MAG: MATE family efflux transporter [Acidobacteriota bacterium]
MSSFWRAVRDSLRGVEQDYTRLPMGRAILLLAIPMVLEMIMESLFAVVDIFWVSHLGPDAVAAVGLTESFLTLVAAVSIGLSMGTTAMVSRRVGEGDLEGAADTAVQAIGVALLTGLAVGVAGALLAPDLLRLMGASPSVIAGGRGYTAILLGGCGTMVLLYLINAVFRGAGDPAISMRCLWLANLLNILLGPFFIFGWGPFPRLGVAGAAVATTIGRGCGVLYQLYALRRHQGRVEIRRRHLRLQPGVMTRLLRISGPGIVQFLIATASWLALVRIISLFGSDALAGYTISIRVLIFAIMPSWGLCNAAATLVGQNLGAGRPDRAERSVWQTGLYNMVFMALVTVFFLIWGEAVIGFFTSDPAVLRFGVQCMRIVSYGYIFYAWGMVMVQAFNGAGDTWTPTVINLLCYWVLQIPLAWALARPLGFGTAGVFWAIFTAESILAIAGMLVFRRGRWKTRRV